MTIEASPEPINIVLDVNIALIEPLLKNAELHGVTHTLELIETICTRLRSPNEDGIVKAGFLSIPTEKGIEWALAVETWKDEVLLVDRE